MKNQVKTKKAQDKIISLAETLAKKFVAKVETGAAKSTETYNDCNVLLEAIKELRKIK